MNLFVLITGVLWFLGAGQYAIEGNWRMVVVSLCYGAATFALVGAK